jgi:hypothetical protein
VKPRGRLIFLCAAGATLFLIVLQFIPFEPTSDDIMEVRQLVEERTSQPILGMEIQNNGEIIVQTGWIKGSLSGEEDDYYFRKIFWRWWVYKRTHSSL